MDRAFTNTRRNANSGRTAKGVSNEEALVELNLRPGNPFAHPVPGDVVGVSNILLKVTKRKRKRRTLNDVNNSGGDLEMMVADDNETEGRWEFVAEAVGIIHKTVRFRSVLEPILL